MFSATELSVEKRWLANNTFQISMLARNVHTAASKGAGVHGTVDALFDAVKSRLLTNIGRCEVCHVQCSATSQ
jgi:hypothetical protein